MSKVEIIKRPVEKVSDNLKKSAWSAVAESLITMILGILLIVWPDVIIQALAYVIGIFFVVKGAYQIINYFLVKGQNDFFNNNLLFGIVSTLIGIAALVMGQELAGVFRVIIGIWLTYESLVRMNTAIKLNAAGISVWKYVLILALVMLVLGIFITFNSGAVVELIGWTMVITGLIGIVDDVMFIQYVNKIVEKVTGKNQGD
ncbi:DUF308 domain-containing protein [Candidatus Saccharibacteria bacterium]|nr:DUF308 domain-containing protein [Candidatus Saccharibacteria bacterium]